MSGTLLPYVYADARCIDAVIVLKASSALLESFQSHFTIRWSVVCDNNSISRPRFGCAWGADTDGGH